MAEEENTESTQSVFPRGRVKNIMKLDKDINKITGEALLLISRSAELFLQFLAEKSSAVAIEKKRKTVKLEHMRIAVKQHQPMSDFLLDSLPPPQPQSDCLPADKNRSRAAAEKPLPANVRRIDQFFSKPAALAEGAPDKDNDS